MFSKIVFLIFAAGIISTWSEPIRVKLERRHEQYQDIIDCLGLGYVAVFNGLDPKSPMMTDTQRAGKVCVFIQTVLPCLLDRIRYYQDLNVEAPKLLRYSIAFEAQHDYLIRKSDMCPNLPAHPQEVNTILEGVLREGQFKDIRKLPYDPCVGGIITSCFAEMEKRFEEENDRVNPSFNYIECYEGKFDKSTCKPPILGRFIENAEVTKVEWELIKSSS